jgi:hypothetical protein
MKLTKLQHLGGIHSGCATSGAVWLVFRIVLIIVDYRHFPASIVASGIVTSAAVFISIASAVSQNFETIRPRLTLVLASLGAGIPPQVSLSAGCF